MAKEITNVERMTIAVRMDKALFWKMKVQAAKEHRKMYQVVEEAFNNYLELRKNVDKNKGA